MRTRSGARLDAEAERHDRQKRDRGETGQREDPRSEPLTRPVDGDPPLGARAEREQEDDREDQLRDSSGPGPAGEAVIDALPGMSQCHGESQSEQRRVPRTRRAALRRAPAAPLDVKLSDETRFDGAPREGPVSEPRHSSVRPRRGLTLRCTSFGARKTEFGVNFSHPDRLVEPGRTYDYADRAARKPRPGNRGSGVRIRPFSRPPPRLSARWGDVVRSRADPLDPLSSPQAGSARPGRESASRFR